MLTSTFPRYEGDHFGPFVLEYCRELVRQGHQVTVIAPRPGLTGQDLLSGDGIRIIRFNYWWPRKWQKLVYPPGIIPRIRANPLLWLQIPFMLVSFYLTCRKVCRSERFDIIHSQWVIPSGFVGALAARKTRIPHVITSQGAEFYLSLRHPFSMVTRWVLNRCDKLFPVSEQMASRALKYGVEPDKVNVIPNAVNIDVFHPGIQSNFRSEQNIPYDAIVFLTIRRLVPEKRVQDLIKAFAALKTSQHSRLVIGGDGPELTYLNKLVAKYEVQDSTIFLGFVDNKDLPVIYAQCDVYVLSSQQEGLSLSLLEAMACGCIPVTTMATGGTEVVEDEKSGFLFKVGDTDHLEQICRRLLTMNPQERHRLSKAAVSRISNGFTSFQAVTQWVDHYKILYENRRMKVIIDVNHPFDVHFFKETYRALVERGHKVMVTASAKPLTFELLEDLNIPFRRLGSYGRTFISKAINLVWLDIKLWLISLRFKPDLILGHISFRAAHVGWLSGIRNVIFTDTDHATEQIRLYKPFARRLISPDCFHQNLGPKHVKVGTIFELAYLHPDYFKPNPDVLAKHDLTPEDRFFIVRLVAWDATHDTDQSGFSERGLYRLLPLLESYGQVLITSERPLPQSLRKYEFQARPSAMHHFLYYAHMYIGEGGTMASEAAVLGTPSLYMSTVSLGYLDYLESEYGLVKCYKKEDVFFEQLPQWVNNRALKTKWEEKKKRLLLEMEDVNSLILAEVTTQV